MDNTEIVQVSKQSGFKEIYRKIKRVIGFIAMTIFHLRKIALAAPVIYYAMKLAAYNQQNLPDQVGIFLQNNGEFAQMIDKGVAVSGPFMLTCACLVMMLFSRKAMYAWAISIFTLALPVLLLISNIYPA